MPKGFEIAEKNGNKQTDKHFRIYISRDDYFQLCKYFDKSLEQGSKFTKLKKPAKTVGPNKKACSNG